jgi:hydroxymethylglutaryl-CoA reductase
LGLIKKFREMDRAQRLRFLKEAAGLSKQEIAVLLNPDAAFNFENANKMIENTIGILPLPLGIATNFVINGKEYIIPMAIEEPSVIAAASNAAKLARHRGGFKAIADEALMIGQVQLVSIPPLLMRSARKKILLNKEELLTLANSKSRSAGAKDLQVREVVDRSHNSMGRMLIVELIVDPKDSMGANTINTMCETISPKLEALTAGSSVVRIVSNYSTRRLVRCEAIFARDELGGDNMVERILYAYALAYSDPYRAVTHNKGVMNGIDSVALATGQDFRAIEAAAHAYAARDGNYRSMTLWSKTNRGDLIGELELPIAVGTVGGVISVHPMVKLGIKILGVRTAKELAMVLATVGLAQNLAAMRALVSEGIQRGHMRLHAKNIATMAGAKGTLADVVAKRMAFENNVNVHRAREIISLIEKDSRDVHDSN